MKKDGLSGRSITEARGIMEEINGRKKTKSGTMNRQIRGMDQSPSGFMIAYRQRSEYEAFEKLKSHASGGKTKHSVRVV